MNKIVEERIRDKENAYTDGIRQDDVFELNLSHCDIEVIPSEIAHLSWLKKLILRKNPDLYDLSNLSALKDINLTDLNLSYTAVKVLNDLSNLKHLTHLDLSNTPIQDIGPLAELNNLQQLNISNTPIRDLSPLKKLSNLANLNISATPVDDLVGLKKLKKLTHLDISNTGIKDLGPINDLTSLVQLKASDAKRIEEITPLHLDSLEELYLFGTRVNNLAGLAGLNNLKRLDIYKTRVHNLTPLASLKHLTELNVFNTYIKDISPLSELKQLAHLNISDTAVSDLSPLESLTNLASIDFHNSHVSDLRPIRNWIREHLYTLNTEGCNITDPPSEIIQKGYSAILDYFETFDKDFATKPIYEAKLLILGEPGAGKTTLARKIKKINAQLPTNEDSTKGIAIETIEDAQMDQPIKVHIWDFGGQHIYRGTHRFFLTKRSTWVIVIDDRRQDTDLEYWLQLAETYGEGCPVYIVVNRRDDRYIFLNEEDLKSRFKHLQSPIFIANFDTNDEADSHQRKPEDDRKEQNKAATKGTITMLIKSIYELPHTHEKWPIAWHKVRQELEKIKQDGFNDIPIERYQEICEKYGITELNIQSTLSGYLHDLGLILHFQEEAVLKRTIILNMLWATEGFFKAFDHPLANKKNSPGFFTKDDAERIWGDERDKHDQLLALMEKYKLTYQTKESNTYVIPDLLPLEEPDFTAMTPTMDIDKLRKSPVLQYIYSFMPPGIFTRLMAELSILIDQQTLVWRKGMLLQYHDTYALIIEDYKNKKITIRSMGNNRLWLLGKIIMKLDEIHSWNKLNLKYKKSVSCICSSCQEAINPHIFDYESLIHRQQKGKKWAECYESFDQILVSKLLETHPYNESPNFIPLYSDKEKIKGLLEEAKTKSALQYLAEHSSEAIVLLNTLSEAQNQYNRGTIDYKAFSEKQAQVTHAALNLLENWSESL